MQLRGPVRQSGHLFGPHKAFRSADFARKNVLTSDPFGYVDLWLARNRKNKSRLFWKQAREFYQASKGLSVDAQPVLLYYCFMNAAKALLESKGIEYDEAHGIKKITGNITSAGLDDLGVRVGMAGIGKAVSGYFLDEEQSSEISLRKIFSNLLCVHRAYCLTFEEEIEKFILLRRPHFALTDDGFVVLDAHHTQEFDWSSYRTRLPSYIHYVEDESANVSFTSSTKYEVSGLCLDRDEDFAALQKLNNDVRPRLVYMNGPQTLWYISTISQFDLQLSQITLMLIAMHRLSETCRYQPELLAGLMAGQQNWLISEFLDRAPSQFIDEISCEITGDQILQPGVRVPK